MLLLFQSVYHFSTVTFPSISRGFGEMAIGETEVELILETAGVEHIQRICDTLRADNFKIKNEP